MNAIEISNLTKAYGEHQVLKSVSISFEKGKIHGLVGRNGSGKTVLMKCICGLTKPDRGTISFPGYINGLTPSMGIIIEEPGFLPRYSAMQNLWLLAELRHRISRDEVENAIRQVGLDPASRKHVGKYSMGMRQRLGIAQAIMEQPEILLLDEPFNGLDQAGVDKMRELFLEKAASGVTIILASHHGEDIDQLCNTVSRMESGVLTKILNV